MTTGVAGAVLAAASFTWLGMVLAISFLEAPLKFRAPGVTARLGLGIGRLVFAALNRVELALLGLVAIAVVLGLNPARALGLGLLALILAVQLLVVRPRLNRRADRVLAGEDLPRSRAHHAYVILEVAKVVALVLAGAAAFIG
jgi:hypothetical protein